MRYSQKRKYAVRVLNELSDQTISGEIAIQEQLMKLNTFTLKLIYERIVKTSLVK